MKKREEKAKRETKKGEKRGEQGGDMGGGTEIGETEQLCSSDIPKYKSKKSVYRGEI